MQEVVDGQQLHGGHAQRAQVLDGGRVRQPGIGAPDRRRDARVAHREALDVDLVQDRVVIGDPGTGIVSPVEVIAADDRARHERRTVRLVAPSRRCDIMAEDGRSPLDGAIDGAGIGVEEQLARVAAAPGGRVPRPVDAVAVALARSDAGKVAMPAVAGHLGQVDAALSTIVVEETELDTLCDPREDAEIGAQAVERRAQRIGPTGPHRCLEVATAGDARVLRHRRGHRTASLLCRERDGGRHWTRTSDLLHVKQVL